MIPDVRTLAKKISTDLFSSRKSGKSSPECPVTSQTMCTAYKALYQWDITDREIREATKLLVEERVPIGSTLHGYYYVLKSEEWQPTIDMLMPKFLSMKNKIESIRDMEKEMAAKEQGQLDIPLMEALNKKLDLEKI